MEMTSAASLHTMVGDFSSKIGTNAGQGELLQFGTELVRMMNASDHLSEDNVSVLVQVVDLINNIFISNLDTECESNNQQLAISATALQTCNDDMTDPGQNREQTTSARDDHLACRGYELGNYTQRQAKTEALYSHIMAIVPKHPPAWQTAWKTNLDFVSISDYFKEAGVYVDWFGAAKTDFLSAKSASSAANSTHTTTKNRCDVEQGSFEQHYFLFSQAFATHCGDHSHCWHEKSEDYDMLLERLQLIADHHHVAYEAAIVIVAKIECLTGSGMYSNCSDPFVDPNRYLVVEPTLPVKNGCDQSEVEHTLCSAEFLDAEYGSLDDDKTPPATCLSQCHDTAFPPNHFGLTMESCHHYSSFPDDCESLDEYNATEITALNRAACCECGGGRE